MGDTGSVLAVVTAPLVASSLVTVSPPALDGGLPVLEPSGHILPLMAGNGSSCNIRKSCKQQLPSLILLYFAGH